MVELRALIGEVLCAEFESSSSDTSLQKCFTALMTCDADVMATQLSRLVARVEETGKYVRHVQLYVKFLHIFGVQFFYTRSVCAERYKKLNMN